MKKRVHEGSGNVFADIGVKNPEEALLKAQLVRSITRLIDERGLTQVQAARILGVDQPKVSLLYRGQLGAFSVERLLRFLAALRQDVRIVIEPARRRARGKVSVEAA
ncbi:MAG: helix-turn-helix domain-containing protein [Candidatus Binatia bacterium]